MSAFDDVIQGIVKERDSLKAENTKLKEIIIKVADIIHNIPKSEGKIEKEIRKAWKILDKARI